ncbi:putative pectinesterase/pectinesterase inhibitor 32 [Hibiscus syriacus]|uniref:Pectinesterase/pectinesterase inhibitor 32 n=1 Tax=Hibiscus syriacus TaxID=106335 RepID=A0A6A2WID4_HIBSY|nr:putative pectinesterase/pectinesterase inhibitor 32 [Hibiscus syriacus]
MPNLPSPSFSLSVLFVALCFCTSSNAGSSNTDFLGAECLTVPAAEFAGSLRTTIDALVPVCFQNPTGTSPYTSFGNKHNSTGDVSSDLRTWLSAAMANQQTCMEGFDGTNGIAKTVVSVGLNQVTSLVSNLLTMVHPGSSSMSNEPAVSDTIGGRKSEMNSRFPTWFKREDRRLLQANGVTADVVVAADGTGNFTTIMDAVMAAPDYSMNRFVIYVKKGLYKENVEIKKKKWNLVMIGDGMDVTVISGTEASLTVGPRFAVSGRGFLARDITFENTAGPEKHQAVALRSDSDLSVFFRYHRHRGFHIRRRRRGVTKLPNPSQARPIEPENTITAQGRKDPNQPTGFSIQFCNITADTDLLPNVNSTATYFGRPWKLYSRTVFMKSYIGNAIRPQGWLEWNQDFALDTLYYAEFMNFGPVPVSRAGFSGPATTL